MNISREVLRQNVSRRTRVLVHSLKQRWYRLYPDVAQDTRRTTMEQQIDQLKVAPSPLKLTTEQSVVVARQLPNLSKPPLEPFPGDLVLFQAYNRALNSNDSGEANRIIRTMHEHLNAYKKSLWE